MLRFLAAFFVFTSIAHADFREFKAVPIDANLGAKLTRAADASLRDFPRLTADNLALSVIDLTKPGAPVRADYHGDASFYPASLVELFCTIKRYCRRSARIWLPKWTQSKSRSVLRSWFDYSNTASSC
jgi:hypothetical protein